MCVDHRTGLSTKNNMEHILNLSGFMINRREVARRKEGREGGRRGHGCRLEW